jgi:prepilin-type N-terminal cleavage/methylation domain-containing protein
VLRIILNRKGFTLIELTTAIVIVSILSVMAGMGLVQIANGYAFARKNAVAAEQAQIVLARVAKELTGIEVISPSSTATSMIYKRVGTSEQSHILAWTAAADQPLTLDNDTLIDKVQSFSIAYYDYDYLTRTYTARTTYSATAVIELTFSIKVYNDIPLTFVQRVAI